MAEQTWQEILRNHVDENGYLMPGFFFEPGIPLDEFAKELLIIEKERKRSRENAKTD